MAKKTPTLERIIDQLPESIVNPVDIVGEIEQSFLDYSMSVITSRALPDIKDGLKPVHRRIIFAAHQEGLYNNKKFKKSAALVGTVMGSYHPHGDNSIYEALARLSQDFSMRYPLIEGQGNFGSIDGDAPAAMRYTEVKLSKLGEYFLDGIKENSVDFVPNYDGSKEEPIILPTILPNILLNGCTGIAVGLATNIPPHNLNEVCDAIITLIENPNITASEINTLIKGPDFPTGGEILNYHGVEKYLNNGSGSFVVRSKVIIESEDKKNLLIIKEIPYGIKKINLIKRIISLVKPGKNEVGINILENNIINIRDESNLEGIRLIIECKKNIDPEVILNNLYKYTQLQERYAANLTILVDKKPEVLNILDILKFYLRHQLDMLIRRTKFNLKNIIDHLHILDGRKIVTDNLLEVIDIISKQDEPEKILKTKYALSDIQVKDILDLPLRRIKKIEQTKLIDELNKFLKNKEEHELILKEESIRLDIIKKKILDLKNKFGDARKTRINIDDVGDINNEKLISNQKVIITLSAKGYISQIPLNEFRLNKRGGVGVKGSSIYQDDTVKTLITANPLDDILLFSNLGKVYKLKTYKLDLNSNRTDKATNATKILSKLAKNEKIITLLNLSEKEYEDVSLSLLFATKFGIVKKTLVKHFSRVFVNGKIAFKLKNKDSLCFVVKVKEDNEIFLASSLGKVVKFKATELRSLGRMAIGVKGIKLQKNAILVSASTTLSGDKLFSISQYGIGKITPIEKFRLTKRGAVGVKAQKLTPNKTGDLLSCVVINANDQTEILLMSNKNKINRFKASQISQFNRSASGIILFRVERPTEKIVDWAVNVSDDLSESDSYNSNDEENFLLNENLEFIKEENNDKENVEKN